VSPVHCAVASTLQQCLKIGRRRWQTTYDGDAFFIFCKFQFFQFSKIWIFDFPKFWKKNIFKKKKYVVIRHRHTSPSFFQHRFFLFTNEYTPMSTLVWVNGCALASALKQCLKNDDGDVWRRMTVTYFFIFCKFQFFNFFNFQFFGFSIFQNFEKFIF
jgi:hypothetical protein